MMRSFLLTLLLSLFTSASVLAVPSPVHGVQPAPWRRLSNFLVETIWGKPAQPLSSTSERQRGYNGRQHVPGNFLARYGRDVVLRFNVTNEEEAASLAEAADVLFLDVWDFTENWLDVRLAKDIVPSLLGLLPDSLHTSYATLLDERSLSQAIADNYPMPSSSSPSTLPGAKHVATFSPSLRTSSERADTNIFFTDYQPMSVIRPWMQLLASMFTTHVRLINIGLSFEGRDIPAFRVGNHPTNDEKPSGPRKTIVIMGGSHAREWISITSVTYLAYFFITQYGKSQPTTGLLEAFDFIFIPTINPDGYVYTWDTDRLWRKNRQTTSLRFCRGVDLDRSYGFHWDGNRTQQNPCSESYAGEAPFEGIEAERLRAWAKNETENNNVEFVAFLDLHAYSQQVLYPYSFSCIAEPPSLENLEELALGLAKAMRTAHGGHFYKATSACEGNVAMDRHLSSRKARTLLPRIETGGGSAIDYFLQEMRVKYSYQIKLRDTGSYGFLLPKDNIIPTGIEVVEAVLWLGRYLQGEIGLDVPETQVKLTKPSMEARPEDSVVLTKPNLDEVEAESDIVDGEGGHNDDTPPLRDEEEEAESIQWEFRRRR